MNKIYILLLAFIFIGFTPFKAYAVVKVIKPAKEEIHYHYHTHYDNDDCCHHDHHDCDHSRHCHHHR